MIDVVKLRDGSNGAGRRQVAWTAVRAIVGALAVLSATSSVAFAVPFVASLPASGVTGSEATLRSTVAGGKLGGSLCAFEYFKDGQAPKTSPLELCEDGLFIQQVALTGVGSYQYRGVACDRRPSSTDCLPGTRTGRQFLPFTAPGPSTEIVDITTTETAATVTGSVDPRGNSGLVTIVEYSTSAKFSPLVQVKPLSQPDDDDSPGQVTAILTNLKIGATYHVRLKTTVKGGSPQDHYSEVKVLRFNGSFARTLTPTGTGTAARTLQGLVKPADTHMSYHFEYATIRSHVMAGAGARTATRILAAGNPPTPVSQAIGGLSANKIYYVRLVGTYTDLQSGLTVTVADEAVPFATIDPSCGAGRGPVVLAPVVATAPTNLRVSGCVASAKDGVPPAKLVVGHGTVIVNGMTVTQLPGATITIDTAKRLMSTTQPVTIKLGSFTLRSPAQGALATTLSGTGYTTSLGAPRLDEKLLGFPLGGTLKITPDADGGLALDVAAFDLPLDLGGITAEGTVTADSNGVVTSASGQVGGAVIGPLIMPSLALEWVGGQDWKLTGDIRVPLLEVGVGGSLTVSANKLTGMSFYQASPFPLPLGTSGVFLDFIAGEADFKKPGFTLSGSLGGTAGPEVGGFSLLRLDTTLAAAFDRSATVPAGLADVGLPEGTDLGVLPFAFSARGDFKALNIIPIGSAALYFWGTPNPLAALKGTVGLDLTAGSCGDSNSSPFWGVKFGASVGVALTKDDFNIAAEGSAGLTFFCTKLFEGSARLRASNTGMGICGSLDTALGKIELGAGLVWPKAAISVDEFFQLIQFYGSGCSLSKYTSVLTFDPGGTSTRSAVGARAAAADSAEKVVRLAASSTSAVLRLEGDGGPPIAEVQAPDGRIARTSSQRATVDREHGIVVIPDLRPGGTVTSVQFARPVAGDYKISLAPGSPPLRDVSTAVQQPQPKVTARVTGRGAVKTLAWQASVGAGQKLVFSERGSGGSREIVSTRKTSGRMRFRPIPGAAGRRSVVALVYDQDFLVDEMRVARFSAAGAPKPRRVKRLRVVRGKSGRVTVAWRAAGPAVDHYKVRVRLSDGRRLLRMPRRRSVTLPRMGRGVHVTATVRGVSAAGAEGPFVSRRSRR